jgi:hypothetical protein
MNRIAAAMTVAVTTLLHFCFSSSQDPQETKRDCIATRDGLLIIDRQNLTKSSLKP